MARDKITVDLMLATKQAEREIAKINRKLGDMGKTMGKAFGGGGGGDKARALGSGLSKATVKADEFNKSLEASNARVIAFGASAGLIMVVDRALKAMVSSAIKVEKAMARLRCCSRGRYGTSSSRLRDGKNSTASKGCSYPYSFDGNERGGCCQDSYRSGELL